jgi:putative ABC transport system permease protein
METLLQDLRYAFRTLARSPGFAVVAVLTLALGIGANVAIFSVINATLLRPLPYAEPDRLMMLYTRYPDGGQFSVSLPDFRDWREQAENFEQMAALSFSSSNLTGAEGEPERVQRANVTANFFPMLGARAEAGRLFLEEENRAGAEPVVVLSHGFWQRRFGGDPGVIGQTINLHGSPFTVVGITPPGFRFQQDVDVWTPLNLDGPQGRRSEYLTVIGRVRPGVTLDQARTEMAAVGQRLAEEYPETNGILAVDVESLHEQTIGGLRPALIALMAAVGLVLLIACANVANLMLTRAAAREREMAVRAALGAGRGRIVRQLLTESLVVALIGGGVGLLLALWGIGALRNARAELIPRFAEVGIDAWVLGFALGLAVLTGVAFGLAPAMQFGRWGLSSSLRSGGRGMAGQKGACTLRAGLVLAQVALALMLLVGAGLLIRSFDRLQRVDVGFEPRNVLTTRVALPASQYSEDAPRIAFYNGLLEEVAAAPGVQSAALVSGVPLSGSAGYWSFAIEGRPEPAPGTVVDAQPFAITPGYFQTMRIPVLQGRAFTEQDHAEALRVAIINQEMVRRYWPEGNPIGARITFGDPEDPDTEWMTVVGVVGDVRVTGLTDAPYPQIYTSYPQVALGSMVVALRTTRDPLSMAPIVRQAVHRLDPNLPVYDVKTMEQWLDEMIAQPRVGTALLGIFAAVALLLAAVGIYGLISYTVAQRTSEIGVRLALGAEPRDVLKLVVRQGMKPVLAGIGVGVVAAWIGTRLIRSLLFGVSATDPLTFAGVVLFLAAVALLASYLPARRATRVDPMIALRAE